MVVDIVRPMTEEDLEQLLVWRNAPEVRRFMYTYREISLAEHQAWFARASGDAARHLLIFESSGTPFGFIQFHAPGPGKIAEWGFYLAPRHTNGMGSRLGRAALWHGFCVLNFHKIWGEVLDFNRSSIRFHLKLGFQQEGVLRDQYFDGESFRSIIRFGLLQREWKEVEEEQ